MLVVFTSNAHGDISMFGHVATRLIKLMGYSDTVPNAIAAKDVPDALARLKKAIATDQEEVIEDNSIDVDGEVVEPRVSLYNRAFPLMEMLAASVEEDYPVMWRKQ